MIPSRGPCLSPRARPARAGEGRPWRVLFALTLCGLPLSLGAQTLPSGQPVEPLDRAVEAQSDGSHWLVLRYLAPQIARGLGALDYEAVAPDLDALCEGPGRAIAAEVGAVDQIVIVLLDRPVPRGVSDPEATQYISAYIQTDRGCDWQ